MVCVRPFLFQICVLRFLKWSTAKKSLTCMVCVRPFLFQMCVLRFLKSSRAKEISDLYGLRSAILFQMCVLRFLKWSRAKEISDIYGLRSAIFISDVRFASFWNQAELKKSLTCMVCVRPFLFQMCVLRFLKSSRAKEISDMYGLCSAILFQMCVLRFLKSSRAKEISDIYGLRSAIFISGVRFASFWNQAELKKSLTRMVCVWPFLFQMCVLRILKSSRA